jgi:hypothetical protein
VTEFLLCVLIVLAFLAGQESGYIKGNHLATACLNSIDKRLRRIEIERELNGEHSDSESVPF